MAIMARNSRTKSTTAAVRHPVTPQPQPPGAVAAGLSVSGGSVCVDWVMRNRAAKAEWAPRNPLSSAIFRAGSGDTNLLHHSVHGVRLAVAGIGNEAEGRVLAGFQPCGQHRVRPLGRVLGVDCLGFRTRSLCPTGADPG